MSHLINNVHPVLFSAGFDAGGALDVLYETYSLSLEEYDVRMKIDTISQVQMRVADFTSGGVLRNVYAFTILGDGSLTSWTRSGSTSVSATVTQSQIPENGEVTADFVAIAVTDGSSAPDPEDLEEATQQGGRIVRVKIRKDDPHPIPPISRGSRR
jgi:hypothetical protein